VLKDSIIKFLKLENLVENLTGYVETRIELMKYEVKEDISKVVAKAALYLAIAIMAAFFILFFSFAIAWVLSEKVGTFWGFSIVSFFYIAIAIALLLMRHSIIQGLEKAVKQIIQKKK
jgi:uncharacterized membrane protein YqjE